MMEEQRNPYLALSQLADQNKWCFNIFCPFCGHISSEDKEVYAHIVKNGLFYESEPIPVKEGLI